MRPHHIICASVVDLKHIAEFIPIKKALLRLKVTLKAGNDY
jgi:hypothetical protein